MTASEPAEESAAQSAVTSQNVQTGQITTVTKSATVDDVKSHAAPNEARIPEAKNNAASPSLGSSESKFASDVSPSGTMKVPILNSEQICEFSAQKPLQSKALGENFQIEGEGPSGSRSARADFPHPDVRPEPLVGGHSSPSRSATMSVEEVRRHVAGSVRFQTLFNVCVASTVANVDSTLFNVVSFGNGNCRSH